ncbi:beta-galactosidase [Lysinibacter sp. HNR]|uniref:beta-galactosidase n=1 Tax=Lysinibacter sp. HNR TaxID=3031408 RepID=UPI0024360CE2|nr:beta-galactosidase [Lysinibacter sp. HNR]WGD36976.1 beta-galactosidase [Lysinibacter sp. HNR]
MRSRRSNSDVRPTFDHPGIGFGCDYNPEQWSPEVWTEDVQLMREAGVDLVAINIFGWSHIEPRRGEFDFANLDTIITMLHNNGIRVNLGTGTASAPAWLTTEHPEILPMVEDGTTRYHGGRQAWCPSSPVFREHARALVEQVAKRYGQHPAVALWHVSNELGCHNALCYDETSAAAFRTWLQQRYGTLDALNAAWGTSFWSQRYSAWDEISTPKLTLSTPNPSQVIDFHRFSSDEILDYYRLETSIIRQHSSVPVTTNFMVTAHIKNQDYWSWVDDMDVIANDHYLDHRLDNPRLELSFAADVTRGLAQNNPWLLMESATSAVNWQPHNIAKTPGEMMRNSIAHVARGADAVCFFQWRASVQGSEKYHSALLPHAGSDSDLWREVLELSHTLDSLDEVAGTTVISEVAFIFSWESWWAADGKNRPSTSVRYLEQVHAAYWAAQSLGLTVTMVPPGSDLSGFRLVIVPTLYMVTDAEAAAINDFVHNGGHALITFYSGIVDQDDRVRTGGYPGAFRNLLGIRSEEFAPLLPEHVVTLSNGWRGSLWTEHLRVTTATAVETYVDGPVAGAPAVTRNSFGAGEAWYLSTALNEQSYDQLLGTIVQRANVRPSHPAADGMLEIVRRADASRSFLFVINHNTHQTQVSASGFELTTGNRVDGTLTVPAGAVRVVREDSTHE